MKSVCVLARGETKFASKTCKTARRDLSSLAIATTKIEKLFH